MVDSRESLGAAQAPTPPTGLTAENAAPQANDVLEQAVSRYCHGVAQGQDEDVAPRLGRHLALAQTRSADELCIDVVARDAGAVEVYIVSDDMPLQVEGVIAALQDSGMTISRIEHPTMVVTRDRAGRLIGVVDPAQIPPDDAVTESWIWAQADQGTSAADPELITARIRNVLAQVASVRQDLPAMQGRLSRLAELMQPFVGRTAPKVTGDHVGLLNWLAEHRFVPLGYRQATKRDVGLGIWRETEPVLADAAFDPARRPISFEQLYLRTGVQRSNYPYLIRVAEYGGDGSPVDEHRFVGMFGPRALRQDVVDIPIIGRRVRAVLDRAEESADSYTGQAMLELMQSVPPGDLFTTSTTELARIVPDILGAVPNREVRLFLRADPSGEIITALIYLPRDRYTTRLRLDLQNLLLRELSGDSLEYTARVGESALALLRVAMRVPAEVCRSLGSLEAGSSKQQEIQRKLSEAARSWDDRVRDQVTARGVDLATVSAYLGALDDRYRDEREPSAALDDVLAVADLSDGGFNVRLHRPDSGEGVFGFTFYLCGEDATLSAVLPVLQSLGVLVLDERPFEFVRPDGIRCWVYEFGLDLMDGLVPFGNDLDDIERRFNDAFARAWRGDTDTDTYNQLVLRCGITGREAAMLRAYARYLQQCGFSYNATYISRVLGEHVDVTRLLVEHFHYSFDPGRIDEAARETALTALSDRIGEIISLDADRILRAFVSVASATARTNYYCDDRPVLSFKLRPRDIPQTPQPRPLHEIFVYSPRIEGVHLRFGPVARGGLRWSDRLADYRTEILGLVKAQGVKNAVIVPVGAKGGFIVKRPPLPSGDPSVDRDAQRAEGVACYRQFIAGLLDITDNLDLASGNAIAPARVTRRDGDDTYLVVAADKGTATFSDIANSVAQQYGFWLGDAFASGGSAGYDHKAMGITARGAWESVKRHFREMAIDTQAEDFTVAGIGDMSGDVFGNGMLLSPHIRLVAAFDHRHVFIDPTPTAATTFAERQRLFELPRSSWDDYDKALISPGGGVWSRDRKSIPISPEAAAALGIDDDVTELAPPELIRAILLAPVDLLWNGGIGTYIKSSAETHDDVGDKANDAIRVDGNQLRVKVVGEGGNLGVTERGRIEFDRAGGRINTDAMDNSAGVDCSDHEVNIKILLDSAVTAGALPAVQRNSLLASMTPEVSDLVLADNISQNAELGTARAGAAERVEVHARLLRQLVELYDVDLELEALPTPAGLRKRQRSNGFGGLTSPELATLMAHVKLALKAELLATDLPDNDLFTPRLRDYFPTPLRDRFPDQIAAHSLRREIVATVLVNDAVDNSGITHTFRLAEGSGSSPVDTVRAYVAVTEVFGLHELWRIIEASPTSIEPINDMTIYSRRLLFRASRWMLANRPQPLAIRPEITRYTAAVTALSAEVPGWLRGNSVAGVTGRTEQLISRGVPESTAAAVAISLHRFCLLDIIDVADIAEREATEVGELYFALMDRLGVEDLLTAVSDLEHGDRWHSLARLALRDDLHGALRSLTLGVLEIGMPDESADEKIDDWWLGNSSRLSRITATLAEIRASETLDLATLSVAARQIRSAIT